MKSSGSICSWRARALGLANRAGLLMLAVAALGGCWCFGQASSVSDSSDFIRGVVVNGVTHEPVGRALVVSPDSRFATLTTSEGRFEFALPKADASDQSGSESANPAGSIQAASNRPYMLTVRKPGFLPDPNNPGQNLQNDPSHDLTLTLIPEGLIVGTVTLPTSEAPDSISLQLFRRQVQDGRAHWVAAGNAESNSEGQFRFSDLSAGTYKIITSELLDEDPLAIDPLTIDPLTLESHGPLFGYPPVYYQNASDFGSATEIQLAAGQTQTVNLSLVKHAYYRVKVPLIVPAAGSSQNGFAIAVYAHGRKGPGFSLGYNAEHHAVEGMLPNATYTIEASSFGPDAMTGLQTITVKGASIDGPSLSVAPNGSIPVSVKEEFTSPDRTGTMSWTMNGHTTVVRDARRYLNVVLEPADDFGNKIQYPLGNLKGAGDNTLAIEGVSEGSYWVVVRSSRGYPASIRSGNLDLEHQPLVVGVGGGTSPIEITMRDDTSEISGTVEGLTPPASGTGPPISVGTTSYSSVGPIGPHLYCIPIADSSGQSLEVQVGPDGSFDAQGLAPGAYRLLAFDRIQPDLEYRNPEAMRAYESKGPVVRVAGGQKERVTLQLIPTEH